jgi:hypothetical protein
MQRKRAQPNKIPAHEKNDGGYAGVFFTLFRKLRKNKPLAGKIAGAGHVDFGSGANAVVSVTVSSRSAGLNANGLPELIERLFCKRNSGCAGGHYSVK